MRRGTSNLKLKLPKLRPTFQALGRECAVLERERQRANAKLLTGSTGFLRDRPPPPTRRRRSPLIRRSSSSGKCTVERRRRDDEHYFPLTLSTRYISPINFDFRLLIYLPVTPRDVTSRVPGRRLILLSSSPLRNTLINVILSYSIEPYPFEWNSIDDWFRVLPQVW